MTTPPYDRVIFDCDSTLTRIEGIDELCARDPALQQEVARLTAEAMDGSVPFDAVYGRRLAAIAPRQLAVKQVGSAYIQQAVRGGRELITGLRSLGKEVLIVSGGLQLAVTAFACWLGLRDQHVHAVKILFDSDGRYSDFDRHSPLTRNGGKAEVVAALPPARTAFIGDGITDAETREVVDSFVCFGGVVLRPDVAAQADAVVEQDNLAALLPLLCTAEEREVLARDPRQGQLLRLSGRI